MSCHSRWSVVFLPIILSIKFLKAQGLKTFYLKLKYLFSLMSFPLPREYDAERLNAFKASEAPPVSPFIEIWASGSPFHFQLADKICHNNKDRWRLPLLRSGIKASVMRSDESWEFSNATKRRFLQQGYGETLGWATVNFPARTWGDVNLPINTPHHPCYDLFIAFCTRMLSCMPVSAPALNQFAYLTITHLSNPRLIRNFSVAPPSVPQCFNTFKCVFLHNNLIFHADIGLNPVWRL